MQLRIVKERPTLAIIVFMAILIAGWFVYKSSVTMPITQKMNASIAVSRTPLSAPFYIAEHLSLFKKNGLDLELIEVIGGKNSFKAVMSGQADYGTSSESVLMFESLNKSDFFNLASFVESDNDIKLLMTASNNSVDITDLKGKKIGVIKGSASEYFLSLLLGLNDLKMSDVNLVNLAPNKMQDALENHNVDAVSVWEPYAFKIKKSLGNKVHIAKAKNIYSLSFNLITKRNNVNVSTEKSVRLLKSLKQAIEFIANSPIKSQNIIKERLDLKQDFIDFIWTDYLYRLSLGHSLILTIEDEARWASESGLVDIPIETDFKQYLDPRALSIVDQEAVHL